MTDRSSNSVSVPAPGRLRDDLEISRRDCADGLRLLLKDPGTGKVYLISELAFSVLKGLDGVKSVQQAVQEVTGMGEPLPNLLATATRLSEEAARAGLLTPDSPSANANSNQAAARPTWKKRFDPFYIKIPLANPEPLLRFLYPLLRHIFARAGVLAWCFATASAIILLCSRWPQAKAMLLVFTYFAWWPAVYVIYIVLGVFHEFGHALSCKRFGIRVREVGVLFYFFRLGAYSNVSEAWMQPRRSSRIIVSLAGVYVESFALIAAVVLWALTAPFSRINQIAFVVGCTLVFHIVVNLIPFFRLDGYYVLTDLVNIPNLRSKSFGYLLSKLPFVGSYWAPSRKLSRWETSVFITYGITAAVFFVAALAFTAAGAHDWLVSWSPKVGGTLFWYIAAALLLLCVPGIYYRLQRVRRLQKGLAMPSTTAAAGELQPRSPEPLVVENLSVAFPRFHLRSISLRLEPGKITGLLGHNGAGKTTTLRLIMGLVRKDSGSVTLGKLDHVVDEKQFKSRVGFVPEDGFFYDRMKVNELVSFARSFYPEWDQQVCEELSKTLDLDTGRRIRELSKGNRAKLSLLLAFAHSSDVMLLDEPTSGLDPRSRSEVLRLIREAASNQGRAILFSTHNLHEVEQLADRIVIIDHGKLLVNDTLDNLRARSGSDSHWSLEQHYLSLVK